MSSDERLETALAHIREHWGEGAILLERSPRSKSATQSETINWITTNSPIPSGKLIEVIGAGTTGATTLALRSAAEVTRRQRPVVYIDLGFTFDPANAVQLGIEPDLLLLVRPAFVISGLDIAHHVIVQNAAGLVIVDSTSEVLAAPGGASALSSFLRRTTPTLRRSSASLLFLSLGNAASNSLAHAASLRLQCERVSWLEQAEDVIGYRTCVTVIKNRQAAPGQSLHLDILIDGSDSRADQRRAAKV